jgi:Flp pilus assembly protein TadG
MTKRLITSGQSLVEFALIFPLIILLLMGLFDIGRAVLYYSTLNTAAREGTRLAIVQPDCDYRSNPGACSGSYLETYPLNCASAVSTANVKVCDDIQSKFFGIGDLSTSTITINHPGSGTDDPRIAIDINYTFEPIMPVFTFFIEVLHIMGNITIHVNSQMLMVPVALP